MLRELEMRLRKQNKDIRDEIKRLEQNANEHKHDHAKHKILNDQINRWKDFCKRQEWMHKKFRLALKSAEKRDATNTMMRKRDVQVQKSVTQAKQERIHWIK